MSNTLLNAFVRTNGFFLTYLVQTYHIPKLIKMFLYICR